MNKQIDLEHEFFLLAAQGKNPTAIVEFLYEITQSDVIVCNYNYRILVKRGGNLVENFTNEFLPTDFLNQCTVLDGFYYGTLHCDDVNESFILQMIEGNPLYGYVLLFTQIPTTDFIKHSISAACLALRIELSHLRLEQQTEENYRSEFLEDILYNNINNQAVMIQQGYTWGWDFKKPYMLAVMAAVFADAAQMDSFIDNRWRSLMRYWLHKYWPEIICQERKNQIILFVPYEKNGSERSVLLPVFELLQQKTQDFFAVSLIGGVGCFYSENNQLYRAYQEAKLTIETGLLLKKYGKLLFYDDMGVMRLLIHQGDQELNDYFANTLGLLESCDQEHQSDLLVTLFTYFHCSGDLKKAAKALFIHINTLRYRLKKIEEILNIDLAEYDVVVNLYIALQIGIMLKKIQQEHQEV